MSIETATAVVGGDEGLWAWIRRRRWPLVIFTVALALRLGAVFTLADEPLGMVNVADAYKYEELADEILAGDLLAGDEAFFHSSTGYPYLLALVWSIFGKSLTLVRVLQALAGALTAVVLFAIARRLFGGEADTERRRGEIVGRITGLATAFYGYLAFLEWDTLMTAWELLFLALALWFLLRFLDERGWGRLVGAGVFCGLAALGRPNTWLVALVLAVFLIVYLRRSAGWRWLKALGAGALIVGLCFVCILPVTLRNAAVDEEGVLLSCNGGINLWIGNHRGADGTFNVPDEFKDELYAATKQRAEAIRGRSLSAAEYDAFWFDEALEEIFADLPAAIGLIGRKALLLVNDYEMPNHLDFYFVRRHGGWWFWLLPVGFWLLLPLAVVGLARWRPWRTRHWLVGVYLLLYAVMVVGMFVTGRYRMPLTLLLIPFAAYGVYHLIDVLRDRRWRELRWTVLWLAPAALLVNGPWPADYRVEEAYNWGRLAEAHRRLDDPAGAVAAYQAAIEEEPDNPFFYNNLGLYALERGELEEAEGLLRRAYDLSGGQPDNAANLAIALARRGKTVEVVGLLERALERQPNHLGCLTNLAASYLNLGRPDLALEYSARALELGEAAPQLYNVRVYALLGVGRAGEALGLLERALAELPDERSLWTTRSYVLLQTGDAAGARSALRRALELEGLPDPRLDTLRAQLGL